MLQSSNPTESGKSFAVAFTLCAVLSLVPIWIGKYLPMADLPQHVSLVSRWVHYNDPGWNIQATFELNRFTPYVVAFAIAKPLAELVGSLVAMKIVVSLSIVLSGAATALLARALHRGPWISLLAFVTAFNFNYYWGFVAFMLAVPISLVAIALMVHERTSDHWGWYVLEWLVGSLAFFTHALAGAVVVLVGSLIAFRASSSRTRIGRLFVVAGIIGWAALWAASTGAPKGSEAPGVFWDLGWMRLGDLVSMLTNTGSRDLVANGAALVAIGLVVASAGRIERGWIPRVPLVLMIAIVLFAPSTAFGTALLYPRFTAYLLPFALLAFQMNSTVSTARWFRSLVVATVGAWMVVLSVRTVRFNRETEGFDSVLQAVPQGQLIRTLIEDHGTKAFPGVTPFVHFGSYCQAEKGGQVGTDFASSGLSILRFRRGHKQQTPTAAEWLTLSTARGKGLQSYDVLLVRGSDRERRRLQQRVPSLRVLAESGAWGSYAVRGAP